MNYYFDINISFFYLSAAETFHELGKDKIYLNKSKESARKRLEEKNKWQ